MPSHSFQIPPTSYCDSVHKAILRTTKSVLILAALLNAVAAVAQVSPWQVTSIISESAAGKRYRSIVGLTEDPSTGEMYVLDAGRRTIDIIDSSGLARYSFVHWVTDPQTGRRTPGEPNALVVTPEGEILVTDFYSRTIDVLNIRGERIGQIDILEEIGWRDPSLRPEKLSLDGSGRLYVSIAGSRTGVARCLTDGSSCELLVNTSVEGVQAITAMSVAKDGRFAVLDYRGEPAVRVYDPNGRLIIAFGSHDVSEGDLSYPTSFLFAADNTYWIADGLRHAVKHYSDKGEFIEYIGGYGAQPGSVRYPTGVTGDGVGRLVVSERVGGRIQEYVLPGAVYATPEDPSSVPGAGAIVVEPESAD